MNFEAFLLFFTIKKIEVNLLHSLLARDHKNNNIKTNISDMNYTLLDVHRYGKVAEAE